MHKCSEIENMYVATTGALEMAFSHRTFLVSIAYFQLSQCPDNSEYCMRRNFSWYVIYIFVMHIKCIDNFSQILRLTTAAMKIELVKKFHNCYQKYCDVTIIDYEW